jgi:tryptophan-rich sensory protein
MQPNRPGSTHAPTRRTSIAALTAFMFVCFVIAGVGAYATSTSIDTWYRALAKPSFNPRDAAFGPVWTVLYFAIAIAGWRLWRGGAFRRDGRLTASYGLQLALNLGWSPLFFGARMIGAALIDVALLLASIVVTMVLAGRHDRAAAWLMVPYAAWVAFATALNVALWRLN